VTDLHGFGITLVRLSPVDLELVRTWRNDPRVSDYMIFQGYISEEDQKKWFRTVDNAQNHYAIIIHDDQKIGLTHVKNINEGKRSGEGGMFIYPEEYRNSVFSYRAAIVGTDWCFYDWGLREITGRMLKGNRRAIRFNLGLGHVFGPPETGSNVLTSRLTVEAYERIRPGLIAAIK